MRIKPFLIRRIFILFLLAGLITLLFSSFSFAREPIRTVTGTVTKVSDGDTIHVKTPEQTKLTVRLYGVDAPEMPQNQSPHRSCQQTWATLWRGILESTKKQNHGDAVSGWTLLTLTATNAWRE
jgi:hypothetical protein